MVYIESVIRKRAYTNAIRILYMREIYEIRPGDYEITYRAFIVLRSLPIFECAPSDTATYFASRARRCIDRTLHAIIMRHIATHRFFRQR